ncbi:MULTISPECIES: spore coat protein U domain-containing protein [Deefgea]|uniref:Fimbrial major subunit CsuA/B family protein n=1 Tax=Deefgea chitinilytica TaxID=570276 RepID=A0ABS2CDB2_9NEIS|nr:MULTISPECIES: spore coat protein U domain-containing protein [Deefgea]MBM5572148.1 fimbrial major subunit CsuA/B family protein [Deefgea chitinilytica]MBM9889383.1 spore coat protein U domain-containing protein [Deefgea sp. CFH1-16]
MKNILLASAMSLAFIAITPSAFAASTNVKVKANVKGSCSFADGNDVIIDMGTLSANSGDQSKQGVTQFWCSNGVNYTITMNNGLHATGTQKRMQSNQYYLPYTLTLTPTTGVGTGPGTLKDILLTATVLGSDINNATVANGYTDTVVLTINL